VRPEAFADAAIARSGKPTIDVDIRVVEELGSDAHVLFSVDAPTVTPQSISSSEAALLLADAQSLFTARLEAGTAAAAGSRLTLSVDPGRFHFFDPASGERFSTGMERASEPQLEYAAG
jgi:multiple sugar transport system ATP-binding protein